MTTFTATLPSTKSNVGDRIAFIRVGPGRGVLTISQKRGACCYRVEEFPADAGQGYRFTKFGDGQACPGRGEATSYDVYLPDPATADAGHAWETCDCHGFTAHGHCKHVEAAHVIRYRGWLLEPVAAAPVEEPAPVAEPKDLDEPTEEPVETILARIARVAGQHFEATAAPGLTDADADAIRLQQRTSVNAAKDMLVKACRAHGITGRAAIIAEWRRVADPAGNPFDTADLDRM